MDILFKAYRLFTKQWYDLISTIDERATTTLMNYGYLGDLKLSLPPSEEDNRTRLQLYYHVVSGVHLKNKIILEVGSGRGGGAAWLTKQFSPKKYYGIDLSRKAIEFCKKQYLKIKNLEFLIGNALQIPFSNDYFDTVINIESSHCYPNLKTFLSEVYRVLKPKGYFLYADYQPSAEISTWVKKIKSAGFIIVKMENITENIIKALDKDHGYKIEIIQKNVPGVLRYISKEFAGVRDSTIYKYFKNNQKQYWNFVLKKP